MQQQHRVEVWRGLCTKWSLAPAKNKVRSEKLLLFLTHILSVSLFSILVGGAHPHLVGQPHQIIVIPNSTGSEVPQGGAPGAGLDGKSRIILHPTSEQQRQQQLQQQQLGKSQHPSATAFQQHHQQQQHLIRAGQQQQRLIAPGQCSITSLIFLVD